MLQSRALALIRGIPPWSTVCILVLLLLITNLLNTVHVTKSPQCENNDNKTIDSKNEVWGFVSGGWH